MTGWVSVALVLFVLCGFSLARADDGVRAARAIAGDEIVLQDGRVLRLAGVKALAPGDASFLQEQVAGHTLLLQNAVADRYGRVDATVFIKDQAQPVEDALLKQGIAFVYPATGDNPRLDGWLVLERAARQDRRGWWADHPDTSSDAAEKLYGHYGFVVGTVAKAERVKNKVYLNFGADWRTDFTIAIAAHDLRAFKRAGVDPLDWQGKKLRVRGWVKRNFGPMITVTDPRQIEFVY